MTDVELSPVSEQCQHVHLGISSEALGPKAGPVIGRERQLRDRNDQMRVPGKSFKDVVGIIKIAEDQHAARQQAKSKNKPPPSKVRPHARCLW